MNKIIPFYNVNTEEWTEIVLRKEITSRDVIKNITTTFSDDGNILAGYITIDSGEEIPFYEYVPAKLTFVISNNGELRSFKNENEAGRWAAAIDAPVVFQVRRYYDDDRYLQCVWNKICTVEELCKLIASIDVLRIEYKEELRAILPYAKPQVELDIIKYLALLEKVGR